MYTVDEKLVDKWAPVLEGIDNDYTKRATAQLLENQARSIVEDTLNEAPPAGYQGSTSVGKLGTFQKFAFPLVRRVYPELLANSIVGVQPMQGPVSQIFYLGTSRQSGDTEQNIYSKFNLTYRDMVASSIFGAAVPAAADADPGTRSAAGANIDLDTDQTIGASSLLRASGVGGNAGTSAFGMPVETIGGQIAAWPNTTRIYGVDVSSGEFLTGTGIPEMNLHIEQQPVAARTRKMRALWTLEAQQDLKAYHNLDLERELTDLLGKELRLEIDRELIEDLRMIAYDVTSTSYPVGGFNRAMLDQPNANDFADDGTGFTPAQYLYDFTNNRFGANPTSGTLSNVFMIDFSSSALPFAPQHVGHVYANLLAIINLASADIYKSTQRGPGNWLLCSPMMASLLESAAKLEGGLPERLGPTTNSGNKIEYKGKFAGKYDLYVDPLYPIDEIMMGYKGANAMDAGYVYAPYIPMQQLPTIHDPETFQPRKGILTRYGKVAIEPTSRFYRIIRVVGPTANYLFTPFVQSAGGQGVGATWPNATDTAG